MKRIGRAKNLRLFVIFGILLFGALEIGCVHFFWPRYYTDYLWLIPLFFLLPGFATLWFLAHLRRVRLRPPLVLARLMAFNLVHLVLSAFALFLYSFFIRVQSRAFLLAFGLFYLFFMGLKLFLFYDIDRQPPTETNRLENAEENT